MISGTILMTWNSTLVKVKPFQQAFPLKHHQEVTTSHYHLFVALLSKLVPVDPSLPQTRSQATTSVPLTLQLAIVEDLIDLKHLYVLNDLDHSYG
jgi:hypothetical protein